MNLRKKKDFELNKFITKILFFSSFLSVHPNIAEFCRLKEPDGDGVPIVFVVVFVFLFFGDFFYKRDKGPRNRVILSGSLLLFLMLLLLVLLLLLLLLLLKFNPT